MTIMVATTSADCLKERLYSDNTHGERVSITYNGHTALLSLYRFGDRGTWLVSRWDEDGAAGVNPIRAYAPDDLGMSRQMGASDQIHALNAHLVNSNQISKVIDEIGEP